MARAHLVTWVGVVTSLGVQASYPAGLRVALTLVMVRAKPEMRMIRMMLAA
jgi:hypothetical protein